MSDPCLDLDSALWSRARDDYRAGATAAEVCARHGLGRSAFYARAQAGRWRRADLAPVAAEDDFDAAAPRRSAFEMADLAHRRLSHALERGRLREALGWSRLANEMRALTAEEGQWSWRKLHREAQAAEAVSIAIAAPADDAGEGEPMRLASKASCDAEAADASPRGAPPQAPVVEELCEAEPESPDSFSTVRAVEAAPPRAGVSLAIDETREGCEGAEDWAAWAVVRGRLAEARPDLPWWTGGSPLPEKEEAPP